MTKKKKDDLRVVRPAGRSANRVEVLFENAPLFQKIADNLRDAFYVKDVLSGSFLYVSQAFADIFGQDPDTIASHSKRIADFIHPDDRETFLKSERAQEKDGKDRDESYKIIRADGSLGQVRFRSFPMKNDFGFMGRVVGVVEDRTEKEKGDEALSEAMDALSDARRLGQIGTWKYDPLKKVFQLDKELASILGISRKKAGFTADDFVKAVHPDDREDFVSTLTKALDNKKHFKMSHRLQGAGGDTRTVRHWGGATPEDRNSPSKIQGIIQDITETQRLEEERAELEKRVTQLQKMNSLGAIAGGIANDLNNLLGIIIGNAEMAISDVPGWNPAYHNIEEIRKAGSRAREVVGRLMNFSSVKEQEKNPLDLVSLMENSVALLQASLPSGIKIKTIFTKNSPVILGDKAQMQQVIINLCTYALSSMEKKGGTLEIAVNTLEMEELQTPLQVGLQHGPYVMVRLKDNGPGMKPDILEKIFDPYFSTGPNAQGTGLDVARNIVENHGGTISAESKAGKGTTITLYIPALDIKPPLGEKEAAQPPPNLGRVLLVDDESAMLKITRGMLEKAGYEVTTADCGTRALEAFQADPERFDLVLTDLTMMDFPGDELIRRIRKIKPAQATILCTGYYDKLKEEAVRTCGMDACLPKPFTKQDLRNAIKCAREVS